MSRGAASGGYSSFDSSSAMAYPSSAYRGPTLGDKPGMPTGIPPAGDSSGKPPPYSFDATNAPPSAPPEGLNGGYNYSALPNYDDPEMAPDMPPPPYEPPAPERQDQSFSNASYLTDDAVKEAVVEASQAKCCYGMQAAREMAVIALNSASALHYALESFTESRKTSWKEEPYVGQPIDSPMYGPSPHPWSIPVQPLAMFKDEKRVMEIPHTAYVIVCKECYGWGKKRCFSCNSQGYRQCSSCLGTGETGSGDARDRCNFCNGTGEKRCFSCNGQGFERCYPCQGMGRLKRYVQLTVKFETKDDDYVWQSINLEFPDKLVKQGSGVTLFEQVYPRVQPLYNHPIEELNQKSLELVQKHAEKYMDKRILMQKHWLRGVPITKANCRWKADAFDVWVYGENHLVYMPDYPQKCCCGCTIL